MQRLFSNKIYDVLDKEIVLVKLQKICDIGKNN